MSHPLLSLDRTSPVIVQGITGRMGRRHAGLMRAYGTNIVGGTSAHSDGKAVDGMPVFADCRDAVAATGAVASIAMTPPHDTLAAATQAFAAGVKIVVTVAEGVPVHDALRLKAVARAHDAVWLGASTPGMAIPGRVKIGFLPDIALRPGSIALMSKSGTLSYEVGFRLAARGLGTRFWIGVGGDSVKGVRFADMLQPFVDDVATKAIIVIGEVGGSEEEEFAERLAALHTDKPVLALIAGREAKEGVAMGHAGALTFGATGTLRSKHEHLARAGAGVFSSISALVDASIALLREPAPPVKDEKAPSRPSTLRW
ncbi:MAG: succinate--CoA ligase subunit alpha [Bradyrhizobiaceae bacterium]|nr:succinate--CoA ligase subunit alpha [Bradyrhizobiaceae bacterium]